MQEIEITVKGLSYSQGKSGAYALILAEKVRMVVSYLLSLEVLKHKVLLLP